MLENNWKRDCFLLLGLRDDRIIKLFPKQEHLRCVSGIHSQHFAHHPHQSSLTLKIKKNTLRLKINLF